MNSYDQMQRYQLENQQNIYHRYNIYAVVENFKKTENDALIEIGVTPHEKRSYGTNFVTTLIIIWSKSYLI